MKLKQVTSQEDTSISSYGDGGFRIGEQRCTGSILISPRGYYPWEVMDVASITMESLQQIIEQRQEIDILLIGTGKNMILPSKKFRASLDAIDMAVDIMATGAAARTYNILLAEGRKVAAALMAVN